MGVPVLYLLSILTVLFSLRFWKIRKAKPRLPPGPAAYPLVGHCFSFPLEQRAQKLHELSKTYGDVMYFDILGQKTVVLSSEAAANELLNKRGAIYSDRPYFATFDLLGWSDVMVLLHYGPALHRQRKILQDILSRPRSAAYQNIQTRYARVLLRQLATQPAAFVAHVRRFTASIILDITYGYEIQADDDLYLQFAEQAAEILEITGRAAIIDLLPFLKYLPSWFPGAWFARYTQQTAETRFQMMNVPFEEIRAKIKAGTARPCFVSEHLDDMARKGSESAENLDILRIASFQLWQAGTDTTWGVILTFILAMLVHPEVQLKAQAEIDRVVGSGRLPDFTDRGSLPFLDCVLQECNRWNPTVALGVPHRVRENDIYRDMLIPKGSTIIVNARAITMDPNIYNEPHEFRPERFLPENGEPYPTGASFGYGRRICVGRYLADGNTWIAAATILASFDIVPARDELGREIIPEVGMTEALVSHPLPFKCDFLPRNSQRQRLIADT